MSLKVNLVMKNGSPGLSMGVGRGLYYYFLISIFKLIIKLTVRFLKPMVLEFLTITKMHQFCVGLPTACYSPARARIMISSEVEITGPQHMKSASISAL